MCTAASIILLAAKYIVLPTGGMLLIYAALRRK